MVWGGARNGRTDGDCVLGMDFVGDDDGRYAKLALDAVASVAAQATRLEDLPHLGPGRALGLLGEDRRRGDQEADDKKEESTAERHARIIAMPRGCR